MTAAPGTRRSTTPSSIPSARQELVDEYEAENGPIELTIMGQSNPVATQNGQYLQQKLGAVGIDVTVDSLELAAFVRRYIQGDYQTVLIGFFGAADPDGSYPFIASPSPDALVNLNFARYTTPELDAASEDQRATDDRAERQDAWATIWQAFADDLPYAFIAHDRIAWVTEADVHGLTAPTTPEGVVLPSINRWTPFYTSVYRSG